MQSVLRLKLFIVLGTALFLVFGFIQPAHAYLDPGSGSLILQGIIAGIAAIGVVAKIYWDRLLGLLNFKKDVDPDDK